MLKVVLSKKKTILVIISIFLFLYSLTGNCETWNLSFSNSKDTIYFRVMTYNALKFSYDDGVRAMYFQKVFNNVNPDIVIMQEIVDEGGADTLLNRLNADNNDKNYERAQFIDGEDTDNILFYNA